MKRLIATVAVLMFLLALSSPLALLRTRATSSQSAGSIAGKRVSPSGLA